MLATACGTTPPDDKESPVKESIPAAVDVDNDRVLEADTVGALTVRRGATLTVTTSVLSIHGDLALEEGARIDSANGDLTLIVTGKIDQQGEISSYGDLVIVDDASRIPSSDELGSEDPSSEVFVEAPEEPPAGDEAEWNFRGELVSGAEWNGATPRSGSLNKGKDGARGSTIFISTGRIARIAPRNGAARRSFEIADGKPGEDRAGCNQLGGRGGRGGKLFLYATALRLNNVDFVGGNGAPGGEAVGADCPDQSKNVGGDGAKPGTFKIRTSRYLVIDGTVTLDGFNAGRGAAAGISGLPGAPGASVGAFGGMGGTVAGYRFNAHGLAFAGLYSTLEVSMGNAGAGGDAEAFGGHGSDGNCANPGGDGGNADAIPGPGGNVELTSLSHGDRVVLNNSFRGGDGGNGHAEGGHGGHGAECPDAGGDGGNGGDSFAFPGLGGSSTHAEDGVDGTEFDLGGNGGSGGLGWDLLGQALGGHGGRGGAARAGHGGPGGHGGDAECQVDLAVSVLSGTGGPGGDGGNSEQAQAGDGGDGGCPCGAAGAAGVGPIVASHGSPC